MRTLPLLLLPIFAIAAAYGQNARTAPIPVAPVPQDPLELVTGTTQIPAGATERGTLVVLINRAIDNYALHARGTPAHVLQISFNATASTRYQGGAGSLRETWISGQHWRWDGAMPGYSLVRISSNGAVFDQNADSTIPMRIKMLANAVFAPVGGAPRQETLRTASVTWKGLPITCILTSAQSNPQVPATGRQWYETEYCIDPASGLLYLYSIAPGIYTVYDYTSALQFHGRVLPGRIMISENGTTVVDAQLTGITDTDASNTGPFTPTAQMIAQGPASVLGSPARFPLPAPAQSPGPYIQSVIVHAIIDEQGNVRELEALQSSSVTAAALDFVTGIKHGAMKPASGSSSMEREAFMNVQFLPAR
jgi:hypothetical protein